MSPSSDVTTTSAEAERRTRLLARSHKAEANDTAAVDQELPHLVRAGSAWWTRGQLRKGCVGVIERPVMLAETAVLAGAVIGARKV